MVQVSLVRIIIPNRPRFRDECGIYSLFHFSPAAHSRYIAMGLTTHWLGYCIACPVLLVLLPIHAITAILYYIGVNIEIRGNVETQLAQVREYLNNGFFYYFAIVNAATVFGIYYFVIFIVDIIIIIIIYALLFPLELAVCCHPGDSPV